MRAGAGAAALAAPAVAVPMVRRARRASGRVGQVVDQTQDAVGKVSEAAGTANKLGEAVSSPAKAIGKIGGAITGRGGGSGGSQAPKLSHLIEQHFDIAVSRSVVYNQWTQLEMFPTITKGVESVDQQDDDKAQWTSKIGPSRRSWTGRIVEQIPDERIVWKSEGGVATEGVVSFHDVGDGITRVMLQMEYHPRGAFEWTANTLRVQRRRVKRDLRLFKHFLEMRGEETGAWRGRIEDGEVVDGGDNGNGNGSGNGSGSGSNRGRSNGRSHSRSGTSSSRRSGGTSRGRAGQGDKDHDDSDHPDEQHHRGGSSRAEKSHHDDDKGQDSASGGKARASSDAEKSS